MHGILITNKNEFVTSQGISYVDEIDTESIYSWLDSMDVKPVTKLNRLKCLLKKHHNQALIPIIQMSLVHFIKLEALCKPSRMSEMFSFAKGIYR